MILLDNAVKFTPPTGVVRVGVQATERRPTLTVSRQRHRHSTPTSFRTSSSDSIAAIRRGRARAARAAAASEGAGLGLSIAQWIAEEHGGTIRVESQAGQGTTCVVQFPRAAAAENLSSCDRSAALALHDFT